MLHEGGHMISNILVATDGSDTAWKAVKYAVGFAKQIRASIILLSVIDKSSLIVQSIPAQAAPSQLIAPIEDYLTQAAEGYIKKAEKLCKKNGVKVNQVMRSGHPVEEIIKEAKKSKADIIVLGSHGKGTIESAVLGSITHGVIHKSAKFPVLVIRK
jgi:nucleotide-binding universal stress UspA family protein